MVTATASSRAGRDGHHPPIAERYPLNTLRVGGPPPLRQETLLPHILNNFSLIYCPSFSPPLKAFNYYSGKAIWPSIWKCPLTPGAPASDWPPPILIV